MPSPIGHSLAGVAIFGARRSLGEPAHRTRLGTLLVLALLVFAANAPDLDFLPGLLIGDADRYHHGPAHSLGAALVFGIVATALARVFAPRAALRYGALMTLAFVAHLLLDMMSVDTRPPRGVPLFWPLVDRNFAFPIELFLDIHRNTGTGNFFTGLLVKHNAYAALWEFVVMGSVLVLGRAGGFVAEVLSRRLRSRRPEGAETGRSRPMSAGARDA